MECVDFEKMKWFNKAQFNNLRITLYILFILWVCAFSRIDMVYETRLPGWSYQYMWNYWWMSNLYLQTIGNVLLYMSMGYLFTQRLGLKRLQMVLFSSFLYVPVWKCFNLFAHVACWILMI